MESVYRFFKRHGFACLGVGLFTVCAVLVFFPALPQFMALLSPDSGPYFGFAYRTSRIEALLAGETFTPYSLYWLLFNPLYAHELTYIVDSFVLALAGVYYLTGRRVHALAAWSGGLALGLSGYSFTLFCAGHRGYFHMFSCAVWAFGLLVRCFGTRKLFYFAMLGLVFAWAVPYQPDVLVLAGAVTAAYALWLTGHPKPGSGSWGQGVWSTVVSVWPRFGLSVLVLCLVGFGGLRAAMTTQLSNRDAQIAGLSAQESQAGKKAAAPSEEEKRSRWIFATNWSLPPEDMLEFVVPGVFGNESLQMPYPYWGRLGRPAEGVFQKGRMMPNYRGHTVYLGVVSVLFALFGVTSWLSGRRRAKAGLPQHMDADHTDVPFWCAVWAVCLVLAMGRYTPFYRLFYSIPYMDYIRAPVKFHHLVEVATAFLAGFGMNAFLRCEEPALRRKLMWLSGGVAGALMICALVFLVAKPQIVRQITELGMGAAAEDLGGYAIQNLMRSVGLATLVAGVAYVAFAKGTARVLVWLGCLLLTLLGLDQAWVASRYVRVIDVAPFYRENAVVKAIKKTAGNQPVSVINYVTPNAWPQEWFSTSLALNGICNLAPTADEKEAPYGRLFSALQHDPVRLWRLGDVRYVIVPRKGCETLLRAGVLVPVLDFELGTGVVRPVQPGDTSVLLARVRDASPAPRFVAGWQGGVSVDKQVEAISKSPLDVSDAPAPVLGRSDSGEAGSVCVISSRGRPGLFATRVKVAAKTPGLLIFSERTKEDQEVLVDGKGAALYVADCAWPAVLVPEGEHDVVLRQKRSVALPLMGALTALAVLAWGAFRRNVYQYDPPSTV